MVQQSCQVHFNRRLITPIEIVRASKLVVPETLTSTLFTSCQGFPFLSFFRKKITKLLQKHTTMNDLLDRLSKPEVDPPLNIIVEQL